MTPRDFRLKKPWRDRDAVFDAMVKAQAAQEASDMFSASYDGEFYGHHRIAALLVHDAAGLSGPYVAIHAFHDEDLTKPEGVGDLPETVSQRAMLKACAVVTVNSLDQARAVARGLVAAWGPEVTA